MAIRCVNIYSNLGTTLLWDSHMKKCLKYKILKEKKLKSSSPSMKNVPSSLMPKVSIMRQF